MTDQLFKTRGKSEADYYPTRQLLADEGVRLAKHLGWQGGHMLEPGCGNLAPYINSEHAMTMRSDVLRIGMELRDVPAEPGIMPEFDYLEAPEDEILIGGEHGWPLIITNPPFTLATAFVERSRDLVTPDGLVIMLLRLSIEGSKRRREFWEANPYLFRYVIRPRPSFSRSTSDNSEYGYFVWASRSVTKMIERLGGPMMVSRFLDCPDEKGWGRPSD